jgi:hypothetical protein
MVLKNSPATKYQYFLTLNFIILFLVVSAVAVGKATDQKTPKPEEIVERSILGHGSRAALYAIQRTGRVGALVKFHTPEGVREGKSVLKFLRKQKLKEDMMMIELDMPDTKYMIGFDGTETWSVYNGQVQKPSPEEVNALHSSYEHSYEAILRYRENNSQLEYVGSKNLGTLVIDIIDLISPEGVRTRYEISQKKPNYHILYLEYEDRSDPDAEPVKYRLNFKNFQNVQNTRIPYETLVFKNGKLVEERKIVEAVFNVKLDESSFKLENANKPIESVPGM